MQRFFPDQFSSFLIGDGLWNWCYMCFFGQLEMGERRWCQWSLEEEGVLIVGLVVACRGMKYMKSKRGCLLGA